MRGASLDRLEPTKIGYVLPIPMEMFDAIDTRDDETDCFPDGAKYYTDLMLTGILERRMNCFGIEYNGHFGSNIYFELQAEDNTEENLTAIVDTINAWANGEEVQTHV